MTSCQRSNKSERTWGYQPSIGARRLKTDASTTSKSTLPTIRPSELLTTYFAASYGKLYEYGSDFIRVLHLIDETTDQKTIRADARRLGWKSYRVATVRTRTFDEMTTANGSG